MQNMIEPMVLTDFSNAMTSFGSSTTKIVPLSREGSLQISQGSPSVMFPQILQNADHV